MMLGLRHAADIVEQLFVGVAAGPRQALGHQKGLERILPQDIARDPKGLQRHFAVIAVGPVVGIDERCNRRIATRQPHRAARARAQKCGVERNAAVPQPCYSRLYAGAETEMKLDIGRRRVGISLPESACLEQA